MNPPDNPIAASATAESMATVADTTPAPALQAEPLDAGHGQAPKPAHSNRPAAVPVYQFEDVVTGQFDADEDDIALEPP